MTVVGNFIYQFEGNQREMLLYLHELFTVELNLSARIRYKIPFYYGRSWICYLNPVKGEKIELAFVRGNELSNYQGMLDNKGRKQVFGVEWEKTGDIPLALLYEIMQEAILLDAKIPYGSKRV